MFLRRCSGLTTAHLADVSGFFGAENGHHVALVHGTYANHLGAGIGLGGRFDTRRTCGGQAGYAGLLAATIIDSGRHIGSSS